MKTKFYFAAMLCAMTAYGNNASADNTPTAQNAATETWTVTQNTRTPKQDHEYPYYASANITILIGANEVWEAPTQLDGGAIGTYTLKEIRSSETRTLPDTKVKRVSLNASQCLTRETIFIFSSIQRERLR